MRSQTNQELRTLKGKGHEKLSQHKKIRKFKLLTKYNSLFHQQSLQKKEFNYFNKQHSITSVNLKELPKTLQAYYSVNSSMSSFSKKACESVLAGLSSSPGKRESFISSEETVMPDKLRLKNKPGGRCQSFRVLQEDITQENE